MIIKMEELKKSEQWKHIKDYPNYKISDTGIVKNIKFKKEKKQRISNGYYIVGLYDSFNKKQDDHLMHRLLAEHFIENPDPINFKVVDHIDHNKENNDIANLQWVSHSMNTKKWHETRTDLSKILQYDVDGNFIKFWDSAKSAGEELKIRYDGIHQCCGGFSKTFKKFIWKYETQDRKQQMKPLTDTSDYKCLGIIKGEDFSNYGISSDGSKIINLTEKKEITFHIVGGGYKKATLCPSDTTKRPVGLLVHKIINQVLKGGRYEDIIDHVNGKKDDNSIDNLEAVTTKENNIRAHGKSIKQIKIDTGETIEIFRTVIEAALSLGKTCGGHISKVCNKKAKTAHGYKWEYVN